MSRTRVRLAVINDVELVVEGLIAMLEPFQSEIEVAGKFFGPLRPVEADVALVDAFGHPHAGIARVQEVLDLGTVEHVVLYTWKVSPAMAVVAMDTGASGILSKSAPAPEIARDVIKISAGERVIHEFPAHVWTPNWADSQDIDLTAREAELLSFVASGYNNAAIAEAMFIAESSVKTYLKRVYKKLGIHSRAQAVMRAVELGIAGPTATSDTSVP